MPPLVTYPDILLTIGIGGFIFETAKFLKDNIAQFFVS